MHAVFHRKSWLRSKREMEINDADGLKAGYDGTGISYSPADPPDPPPNVDVPYWQYGGWHASQPSDSQWGTEFW